VLRQRGAAVAQAGASVKQAATTFSATCRAPSWPIPGAAGAVKLDSNQLAHATAPRRRMMPRWRRSGPRERLTSAAPVAVRGLALAALAVVGRAGEDSADSLEPLLADGAGFSCLHMAKLNLFQCMAVAAAVRNLFCAGQHAIIDTASAWSPRSAMRGRHRRADPAVARTDPNRTTANGGDRAPVSAAAPLR